MAEKASPWRLVEMSLLLGQGMQELEKSIISTVFRGEITLPDSATVTSVRHKDALRRAKKALEELLTALQCGYAVDLLSIDLQTALDLLGEITGETVNEQLADEIFAAFCIGK